jgi:GH25 family lysozyme M1 (1,4-beta-N-acetylmuramidase)
MTINVGGRDCVLGFDWSIYQAPRGLDGTRETGHRFMGIKATEGDAYRDPNYGAHVANAVAADLVPGAYHFARPDWSDGGPYWDGRQEGEHFLSVIDDRIRYAALDLEATALDAARTTDFVLGWWDRIIEDGRFPLREQRLTYVGNYFTWYHAVTVRDRSCLWVPGYTAGYTPDPDPARIPLPAFASDVWPEGWCIWQYSSSGTVAGLHPSDVNVGTVAWFDAITTGVPGAHRMDRQEDDMPRPNYQFAEGIAHPNAKYRIIDLRHGAYPTKDGVVTGHHWFHAAPTDGGPLADREAWWLVANREVDPAHTNRFAAGNDALDALYEDLPHVFTGDTYTAGAATTPPPAGPSPAPVDVDGLVPLLAEPVAVEIAQRAGRK